MILRTKYFLKGGGGDRDQEKNACKLKMQQIKVEIQRKDQKINYIN